MATQPDTKGFATRAIHAGGDPADHHAALNMPVYLSSTFAFETADQGRERFAGGSGYIYHRLGNPTVAALERRLADLEGAESALATASGMGAIASLLWTVLKSGDEIIADITLYGCTFSLLSKLARFGIMVRFVNMSSPGDVAEALSPRTRMLYCETPANPTLRLVDIAAVADIARRHGATFVVDNTFCTPYLQRPLALGADVVVHSATKYLGGHGDLLAGVVAGTSELVERVRHEGIKEMTGAALSAFDAYLLMRGLKTLPIRMDRHCGTAALLAHDLEAHPAIVAVHYPGLDNFPQRELAARQMHKNGGVISVELKSLEHAFAFMDGLRLIRRAVSLGDAESLVQHPSSMTHLAYADADSSHRLNDRLVRLSVGLEDHEDIRADVFRALEICGAK